MTTLMRASLTALGLSALPCAFAANYIDGPQVSGSAYYTGRTGSAQVRQLSAAEWRARHRGETEKLGINSQGFVIEDRELGKSINGIANRLLAQWPGRTPPMALFIQGDKSPLAYGAATTHAREIFIQYGVLLHAESEDEVAAVIGHELAHVLLEHTTTVSYKKAVRASSQTVTQARNLYTKAEARGEKDKQRGNTTDAKLDDKLEQSAMQQMLANQLYDSVHATVFSRENEYDADRLGLDLMVAARYSPMGMKLSLERMAHNYSLMQDISKRLKTSSKELLKQAKGNSNGDDWRDELRKAAIKFSTDIALDRTARTHPAPEERIKQLTDYLYASYSRSARKVQPDDALIRRFNSGHMGQVLAHYRAANESLESLALGKTDNARRAGQQAITRPTTANAYPQYTAFFGENQLGKHSTALKHLQAIAPTELVPVYASVTMASAMADGGKQRQSKALMRKTETFSGTVAQFYPIKIKLARAQGDQTQVNQLARSCKTDAQNDKALIAACNQAAGNAQAPSTLESIDDSIKGLFNAGKKLWPGKL
jgi:Zn-dependent protease with chaperone function